MAEELVLFNTARKMEMSEERKGSGESFPSTISMDVTASICHSVSSPAMIVSIGSKVIDDDFDGNVGLDPRTLVEGVLTIRLLEAMLALTSFFRVFLVVSIPSMVAFAGLSHQTKDTTRNKQ